MHYLAFVPVTPSVRTGGEQVYATICGRGNLPRTFATVEEWRTACERTDCPNGCLLRSVSMSTEEALELIRYTPHGMRISDPVDAAIAVINDPMTSLRQEAYQIDEAACIVANVVLEPHLGSLM